MRVGAKRATAVELGMGAPAPVALALGVGPLTDEAVQTVVPLGDDGKGRRELEVGHGDGLGGDGLRTVGRAAVDLAQSVVESGLPATAPVRGAPSVAPYLEGMRSRGNNVLGHHRHRGLDKDERLHGAHLEA